MDEIFQDVHGFKGAFTVVKVSLTKPKRFGKKGELLIRYEDTEAFQAAERRRSSIAPQGMPQDQKISSDKEEEKVEDSNGN